MHDAASRMLFAVQTCELSEELCQLRGWQIFEREYPILDVGFRSNRPAHIRIRMWCNEYNELPPSIEFLSMEGQLLTVVERDPGGVFNLGPHPLTGRPFICMRGSREYHQHPSHLVDPWDHIRNLSGYDLGGILTQVWRAWTRAH
jgi:hypothetical protein